MDNTPLTIGATVRILPHPESSEERRYVGMIGTLVEIDDRTGDGDAYGVEFPLEPTLETVGRRFIVFFWATELEVIAPPESEVRNG